MKVQLLVLLALAGPLCSFTRASPTTVPSTVPPYAMKIETTTEQETIITDPPPTDPQAVPQDVTVGIDEPVAATEDQIDVLTTGPNLITETTVEVTAAPAMYTSAFAETTLLPAVTPLATTTPALETTTPEETDGPFTEEPKAPTNPVLPEDTTVEAENGNTDKTVEIEDNLEEGLTTGQIVGIVIGAIVAVVIVIAVVIAVLRRMGKYSSTKSRKPAKKDSVVVSPLKKKSTKQQERTKFWKS